MRHVRKVMTMHREACVLMREIARLTGLARSTVRDMIVRFDRSGLAWPVPAGSNRNDGRDQIGTGDRDHRNPHPVGAPVFASPRL